MLLLLDAEIKTADRRELNGDDASCVGGINQPRTFPHFGMAGRTCKTPRRPRVRQRTRSGKRLALTEHCEPRQVELAPAIARRTVRVQLVLMLDQPANAARSGHQMQRAPAGAHMASFAFLHQPFRLSALRPQPRSSCCARKIRAHQTARLILCRARAFLANLAGRS